MKQTELEVNERYAISLPGSVTQAIYLGTVNEGDMKLLRFHVPSMNLTHQAASAHCVLDRWDRYAMDRQPDVVTEGFRAAKFEIQAMEVNSLIAFFRMIDVDAGLMSVTIAEGEEIIIEPALYLKYKDINKILDLLKKMSLFEASDN